MEDAAFGLLERFKKGGFLHKKSTWKGTKNLVPMSQEESLSVERLLKKLNSSEFQKHMLVLGFFLLKVIFFLKKAYFERSAQYISDVCMYGLWFGKAGRHWARVA